MFTRLHARHAGKTPKTKAVATVTRAVNANTRESRMVASLTGNLVVIIANAGQASGDCQQDTLRHELPDEAFTSGPKCRTQGQFFPSDHRFGQQQICQVRTRD
jgi:hypothetical protein